MCNGGEVLLARPPERHKATTPFAPNGSEMRVRNPRPAHDISGSISILSYPGGWAPVHSPGFFSSSNPQPRHRACRVFKTHSECQVATAFDEQSESISSHWEAVFPIHPMFCTPLALSHQLKNRCFWVAYCRFRVILSVGLLPPADLARLEGVRCPGWGCLAGRSVCSSCSR
jgi:hypothetical protein